MVYLLIQVAFFIYVLSLNFAEFFHNVLFSNYNLFILFFKRT